MLQPKGLILHETHDDASFDTRRSDSNIFIFFLISDRTSERANLPPDFKIPVTHFIILLNLSNFYEVNC